MKKTLKYNGKTFVRHTDGSWIDSTGNHAEHHIPTEDLDHAGQESIWEKNGWILKMTITAAALGCYAGAVFLFFDLLGWKGVWCWVLTAVGGYLMTIASVLWKGTDDE